MHTFTDKTSRKWEVEIDFFTVDALRSADKFDLLDHARVVKAITDSTEIYKLIWALVEEQATKASIDAKGFAKLLVPVFKEARDALLLEVRDFFQSCQSPDKALAVEEMRIVANEATEQFQKMSKEREAEIRSKGSDAIQTTLRGTFGDLVASLDKMSKPADAPGESLNGQRLEPAVT